MKSAERTNEEILGGYFRYCDSLQHGSEGNAQDEAGWTSLNDIVSDGPIERAWELVQMMIQEAPDDKIPVHAAGALESLVRQRGAELVDAIESKAKQDERFRFALGCIWLCEDDLPRDITDRIVDASGGQIHPLGSSNTNEHE